MQFANSQSTGVNVPVVGCVFITNVSIDVGNKYVFIQLIVSIPILISSSKDVRGGLHALYIN